MKKRTLEKLCDYWEGEARRYEKDAVVWRQECLEAKRTLEALRADPLATFRAEFRSEAIRQIDAWPSTVEAVEPDERP